MNTAYKFEGYEFTDVIKFDGIIIHLQNEAGGSYFTVLPVSGKPNVCRKAGEHFTEFIVTDDWNDKHEIRIPNHLLHKVSIPE